MKKIVRGQSMPTRGGSIADRWFVIALATAASVPAADEPASPRARDLGIPFEFGTPGRLNAITDVPGVEVGHVTLVDADDSSSAEVLALAESAWSG